MSSSCRTADRFAQRLRNCSRNGVAQRIVRFRTPGFLKTRTATPNAAEISKNAEKSAWHEGRNHEHVMSMPAKLLVLAFATLATASQACTLASPTTVETKPLDDANQDSDATESTKSNGTTTNAASKCEAKLVKVDVSKLTACGDGAGHCYPKSKVPGDARAMLACNEADEVCVADAVLTAGGGKLKSCKVQVLSGAAGACISLGTMPEGSDKDQAKANLKQDACAAGEVCAPCTNPLEGNADTGICGAVGVSDGDCGGGTGGPAPTTPAKPAQTCCGGKGTCLDGKALAEAGTDLKPDSCRDGLVCAPQSLVTGKPMKCDGGLLGDGICLGKCFDDTLNSLGAVFLDQGSCDKEELCVPCTFASKMAPDGTKVPGCE
jgi:hypothetical protein